VNHRKVRKLLRKLLQARCERRVEFDGTNRGSSRQQLLGHFTVARADFEPAIRLSGRIAWGRWPQRRVRRNADGSRDLFAPVSVRKKMLAKSLTSHAPKV